MSSASATTANRATKRSGVLCSETAASVRLSVRLSEMAEKVFEKPYRALVDILRVSERDAHYRLSATRKYSAVDIARLLQSEEGIHFLVVLMDKAKPRWWQAVLKMGALGSIEQRRQSDLRLMRRVFHADGATSTTFTDSFRAQDPDFFGAVLAGYDELSAVSGDDSALAEKRGRK